MLVAGGIICGIFLIFIEIAYKNRKDKKMREHDVARNAFATWRKNVEKRKLRLTRDNQEISLSRKLLLAARQQAAQEEEEAAAAAKAASATADNNLIVENERGEESVPLRTILRHSSKYRQKMDKLDELNNNRKRVEDPDESTELIVRKPKSLKLLDVGGGGEERMRSPVNVKLDRLIKQDRIEKF